MHAAVETLLKYGDVAGSNLEAPINPLFKEYLELTNTRNLLAIATISVWQASETRIRNPSRKKRAILGPNAR